MTYIPDLIDHYVEEAGETLQCIGKFMRFGPHSTHPNGGPSNVQHLYWELEDVIDRVNALREQIESSFNVAPRGFKSPPPSVGGERGDLLALDSCSAGFCPVPPVGG